MWKCFLVYWDTACKYSYRPDEVIRNQNIFALLRSILSLRLNILPTFPENMLNFLSKQASFHFKYLIWGKFIMKFAIFCSFHWTYGWFLWSTLCWNLISKQLFRPSLISMVQSIFLSFCTSITLEFHHVNCPKSQNVPYQRQ